MGVFLGEEFEKAAATETKWLPVGLPEPRGDLNGTLEYGATTGLYKITVADEDRSLISYVASKFVPSGTVEALDAAKIDDVSEKMALTLEGLILTP